MKKLLLFVVSVLLLSCSAESEEQNAGTLSIPEKFHGNWIGGDDPSYLAKVESGSVSFNRTNENVYVTEGEEIPTENPNIYTVELSNGKLLMLIFSGKGTEDLADDELGIYYPTEQVHVGIDYKRGNN